MRFFNEKIFFSFFLNLITKKQLKLMSFHEKCHFAPKWTTLRCSVKSVQILVHRWREETGVRTVKSDSDKVKVVPWHHLQVGNDQGSPSPDMTYHLTWHPITWPPAGGWQRAAGSRSCCGGGRPLPGEEASGEVTGGSLLHLHLHHQRYLHPPHPSRRLHRHRDRLQETLSGQEIWLKNVTNSNM